MDSEAGFEFEFGRTLRTWAQPSLATILLTLSPFSHRVPNSCPAEKNDKRSDHIPRPFNLQSYHSTNRHAKKQTLTQRRTRLLSVATL